MVGYCMMIEIAQMAWSYYLNKLRKDCLLKHHGLNDPGSAARAHGATFVIRNVYKYVVVYKEKFVSHNPSEIILIC